MNWSLMLNILLLMGVVVAIVRTLKSRRQEEKTVVQSPLSMKQEQPNLYEDIIEVRKVGDSNQTPRPILSATAVMQSSRSPVATPVKEEAQAAKPRIRIYPSSFEGVAADIENKETVPVDTLATADTPPVMMFLLAKANRQMAGYELLQAVLSAGFRFGEGDLFHRHQYSNGQGPVMCSLAAATPTGVFDLQHIGGFVVRGLCLFMHASGNPTIDAERFDMMVDTAKTLSDGLDAYLLDDKREPLTDQTIARYQQRLSLNDDAVCAVDA